MLLSFFDFRECVWGRRGHLGHNIKHGCAIFSISSSQEGHHKVPRVISLWIVRACFYLLYFLLPSFSLFSSLHLKEQRKFQEVLDFLVIHQDPIRRIPRFFRISLLSLILPKPSLPFRWLNNIRWRTSKKKGIPSPLVGKLKKKKKSVCFAVAPNIKKNTGMWRQHQNFVTIFHGGNRIDTTKKQKTKPILIIKKKCESISL